MREPPSYAIARSADVALDPGLEWTEGRLAPPHRELAEQSGSTTGEAAAGGGGTERRPSAMNAPTTTTPAEASAVPAGSQAPTTVAAFPLRTPPADVRAGGRMA